MATLVKGSNFTPDEPYLMCTQQECEERVRTNEVSIFERLPNSRELDPFRAVSKYRRSAAGFTDKQRPIPRSLEKIRVTVNYLIAFLASTESVGSTTWLQRVQFVEDRLRAVQVDLVLTQIASKELQHLMARLQMMVMYLLIDNADYLQKFGDEALQTALSSYWNDSCIHEKDDEMLSYAILMQCREFLKQEEHESPSSISQLQASCRKYAGDRLPELSLVQWTLQLAVRLALGHWQSVLKMLAEPKCKKHDAHFFVFARCCLAPSIAWLRWKTLQSYNFTWRKGEKVTGSEMARLLCMVPTDQQASAWGASKDTPAEALAAINFGQAMGLPVDDDTASFLLFKVAPLKPLPSSGLEYRDDRFVFGKDVSSYHMVDGIRLPPHTWIRDAILGFSIG